MGSKLKSFLCGAGVAALVIAPSVSGYGQGMPHPPAAPTPGHGNGAVQNFNTTSLKVEDAVGTLIVSVRDSGPMTVQVSGSPKRVNGVRVFQDGAELRIESSSDGEDQTVWDWKNWFNFHSGDNHQSSDLTIRVTVPRSSAIDIDDLVGQATIGDTMGALNLDAASSNAEIGKIAKGKISLGGSGRIAIAGVAGTLELDLGGSGKLAVGPTGNVKADIAGSGNAQFGPIAGGLSLDIAGSGDVTVAHVNGPTSIDIAGTGNVRIADGIANPLHVDIMGAGNLDFGGVAVDPHIDALGSGRVRIKAYRGKLDSEGMAEVKIGD